MTGQGSAWTVVHERRLADIWRSAGWPSHDNIELDLLALGLVERVPASASTGLETLRVTDAGVHRLAVRRQRHQQALSAHEQLVRRVALQQQRAGRVVWCGLSLRAPLPMPPQADPLVGPAPQDPSLPWDGELEALPQRQPVQWAMAMPDVYAIRNTTVEAYVDATAFEIKVSRADLLGDLRRPAKAAAYLALSGQCWYVLRSGIAEVDEIPRAFGVILADEQGLHTARPAPARAYRLPFAVWMTLAKAAALPPGADDSQQMF